MGAGALVAPFVVTIPLLRAGFAPALLAPAACGLAGVVCGCMNIVQGHRGAGVAQIAMGLMCGCGGTMIALSAGVGMDH